MGKYTTLAVNNDEFELIVNTIRTGFKDLDGVNRRPNNKVATALIIETNLGIRISDIVKLTLKDIVKDGTHYRLDIIEKKTKKVRQHTVPTVFYQYLKDYCENNHISSTARIIPVTTRDVQKLTKQAVDFLGLDRVSTHSFRKMAGNEIYESTNHDIVAVQEFYKHSNTSTTQVYLKRSSAQLERVLEQRVKLI